MPFIIFVLECVGILLIAFGICGVLYLLSTGPRWLRYLIGHPLQLVVWFGWSCLAWLVVMIFSLCGYVFFGMLGILFDWCKSLSDIFFIPAETKDNMSITFFILLAIGMFVAITSIIGAEKEARESEALNKKYKEEEKRKLEAEQEAERIYKEYDSPQAKFNKFIDKMAGEKNIEPVSTKTK